MSLRIERASAPETDEAAHHLDHYGRCMLVDRCECNRNGWRGRACPEWRPSGGRSAKDLQEQARRWHAARKPCA